MAKSRRPSFHSMRYNWNGVEKSCSVFIDADILAGIGMVLTNWSRFEQALLGYLEWLACAPVIAATVKRVPYQCSRRIEALEQWIPLALPVCPKMAETASQIAAESQLLLKLRNRVAHSHWIVDDGGVTYIYPNLVGPERYHVTPAMLLEIADRILQLEQKLLKLRSVFIDPDFDKSLPLHERRSAKAFASQYQPSSRGQLQKRTMRPPKPLLDK